MGQLQSRARVNSEVNNFIVVILEFVEKVSGVFGIAIKVQAGRAQPRVNPLQFHANWLYEGKDQLFAGFDGVLACYFIRTSVNGEGLFEAHGHHLGYAPYWEEVIRGRWRRCVSV